MKSCSDCGSVNVYGYKKPVAAAGGYGPDFLPKLKSSVFSQTRMWLVLCSDCGLLRLYATEEAREKVVNSPDWERV